MYRVSKLDVSALLKEKERREKKSEKGSKMELSKVHFKPNLLIFPYLETEVMMSSIFFSQKHTHILAYLTS
jgi:hypothetical protein